MSMLSQSAAQRTEAIVNDYCVNVAMQFDMLKAKLESLFSGTECPPESLADVIGEAHRMAGAATCMGFERFGNALGKLETDLLTLKQRGWETRSKVGLQVAADLRASARECVQLRPEQSSLISPLDFDDGQRMPQPDAAALMRAQRVLIVDDDHHVRAIVRNVLILAGADAIGLASSGQEALGKAASLRPTLIISDWNMSPLTGMELLAQIRSGRTAVEKDVPIVFLTRENKQDKVRAAILHGADHFVVKPFSEATLMRAVRAVLAA